MPSRCTVQAPHKAAPQPNLVPVSPISSRITQSSGVSGSALTSKARPLTVDDLPHGLFQQADESIRFQQDPPAALIVFAALSFDFR